MMTNTTRKFQFDRNLQSGNSLLRRKCSANPALQRQQAELEQARESAWKDGYESGTRDTLTSLEAQQKAASTEALNRMQADLKNLLNSSKQHQKAVQVQAIIIANQIATTISGLSYSDPDFQLSGIRNLAQHVFSNLQQEPRIVIRVSEALLDDVREQLETMAHADDFHGKLIFLSGDLQNGDCTIEWSDGGVDYNIAQRIEAAETVIKNYLDQSQTKGEA